MGEAKRRRENTAKTLQYRNHETGQKVQIRDAGDPILFLEGMDRYTEALLKGGSPDRKVPCNGCRECCWHHGVDVHPEVEPQENLAHLQLEQRPGQDGWFLRKRPDGACIHLGPTGCTVYQHRPLGCRSYDCRAHALVGVLDSFEAGHQQPAWTFTPTNQRGRAVLASWQMLGMVAIMRRGGPEKASAREVLFEVLTDRDKRQLLLAHITTLQQASSEQLIEIFGYDPRALSPQEHLEKMAEARKVAGLPASVYQLDPEGDA